MKDEPGWLGRAQLMPVVLPDCDPAVVRLGHIFAGCLFALETVAFVAAAAVDRVTSSIGWGFLIFVGGVTFISVAMSALGRALARRDAKGP